MIEQLNVFDAVVIGIMLLSCLFAFFRGLVREILSLVAWIGAGVITVYYFPQVAEKLQPHFKNPVVAAGVGTVGLYIAALMCFALVNMLIVKSIKSSGEAGTLDNILGLLFGAFRGAFIIALGYFLMTIGLPKNDYPKWITEAVTRPYVEKGALMLARAAPEYLSEISSLQKQAVEEAQRNMAQQDGNPDQEQHNTGYTRESTHQIDRLIDSSGPTR